MDLAGVAGRGSSNPARTMTSGSRAGAAADGADGVAAGADDGAFVAGTAFAGAAFSFAAFVNADNGAGRRSNVPSASRPVRKLAA